MAMSLDKTICLIDLKDGVVLKKMEGHGDYVLAMAVSGDGQLIASGDKEGKLIVWQGDTGDYLIQVNQWQGYYNWITSLDFSPDSAVLAISSGDKTTKLSTKTWQVDGNPISCGDSFSEVKCVRYSPSGELAIATQSNIEIWNLRTRAHAESHGRPMVHASLSPLSGPGLHTGVGHIVMAADRISKLDWPY
jgi:WD40 repeat protein